MIYDGDILAGWLSADAPRFERTCPGGGLMLIPGGRQTNIVNKIPINQSTNSKIPINKIPINKIPINQDRKDYNDNRIPINK